VHLSWTHLWMNLAALAIVAALFDRILSTSDWLVVSFAAMLTIDAGLYFGETGLAWYVGLSGILHGLMLSGGWRLWSTGSSIGLALLCGLIAKIVWEQIGGPITWSESTAGGPVVVAAHLYGAVGGGIAVVLSAIRRYRPARL
jgi:rhomboid family GlyGly-CTERM serine protease